MTFNVADAQTYIATVRWQVAKTMPKWPHEYTVRTWRPELSRDFHAFVELIRREGTVKPWPPESAPPRYHHRYLELSGWEYWTMDGPSDETTVINRALVDQPAPLPGSPSSGGHHPTGVDR